MLDYAFLDDRPTDLRGVVDQLRRFIEVTEQIGQEHGDSPPKPLYKEWRYKRDRLLTWANLICQRINPERAAGIGWHPSTLSYLTSNFRPYADQLRYALNDLEAWADETELLDKPGSGAWVNVGGAPYSAWRKLQDVVSGAGREVMLVDPYVDAHTLDLLLQAPISAAVRLLTVQETLPKDFQTSWEKWLAQWSGAAECRSLPRHEAPHDRFLKVDGSLYLSGASLKDAGGRLSVVIPLETVGVAGEVLSLLDDAWQRAKPL